MNQVERGLNINILNAELSTACNNITDNQLDTINDIISKAKSLNHNIELRWAFLTACEKGNIELVKFLIYKGKMDLDNGFQCACLCGSTEVAKYLISEDVKHVLDMKSGFNYACEGGYIDIVKFIKCGPDWNLDRMLYSACKSGNMEVIDLVISRANELNYDLDFQVGFFGARDGIKKDVIEYMISKGADDSMDQDTFTDSENDY
jgi:hypothetical protein